LETEHLSLRNIIGRITMKKNIQFTLLIRINKQLHEFNFLKRNEDLYDGDTVDERGDRHYFNMIKENNYWKIQGSRLPKWIADSESFLHAELEKKETG
jgi:hypothetical protein